MIFFVLTNLIPYKSINIEELNEFGKGSFSDLLGMHITSIGEDHLSMSMEVKAEHQQPYGIMHGGVPAALAENVGSLAANLVLEKGKACVGLSLHTNHIKAVRLGVITARATPIHLGRSTQVWEIETRDENGALVNVSRLTMAVIDKP